MASAASKLEVMVQVQGRVVGGVIVVDEPDVLEEGAEVTVLIGEKDPTLELTAEQEAELAEAVAECERGEGVDAFEFLKQLRAEHRGKANG